MTEAALLDRELMHALEWMVVAGAVVVLAFGFAAAWFRGGYNDS